MLLAILIISFFVAVWFYKCIKSDATDRLIAALVFLPALFFLVKSLQLEELTGLGISATFRGETTKSVQPLSRVTDVAEVSLTNDPSDFDPSDFRLHSTFETCADYYILRPDRIPDFRSPKIYEHIFYATSAIGSSVACGRFLGLIVLDENGRYLGSFDKDFFIGTSSLWTLLQVDEQIVPATLGRRIDQIAVFSAALKFPLARIMHGEGSNQNAINQDASIGEAFIKFQESNGKFLAVTDTLGRFKGILSRRKVEAALIRALMSA